MKKENFIETTTNKEFAKTTEKFLAIVDKLIFKEIDLKQELKNIDISSCETTDVFQKEKMQKQRDRFDEIIEWLYNANETKKRSSMLF